jgi:hypothetical protein
MADLLDLKTLSFTKTATGILADIKRSELQAVRDIRRGEDSREAWRRHSKRTAYLRRQLVYITKHQARVLESQPLTTLIAGESE